MSWNIQVASVVAPAIQLGDYHLQTDAQTGAVLVTPASAPTQAPAPVAQPASLFLDVSGLSIVPSAEFGGKVLHSALLEELLSVPIIMTDQGIMSLRSALGRLFTKVALAETHIADVSGAVGSLATESAANAAADALREAIQAAKDAQQDTATAAAQLAAASAAMDISAVSDRVTALEGAPGFDSTAINASIAALETAVGGKADQSAVDAALALKAAAADLAALDTRVAAEETASAAAASRLDAVEAAAASKVAQADYDMYVASNDAAVASAASAAAAAQGAADAAAAVAAAAEVKGLVSKLTVEDISTKGISGAYWAETIGATIAAALDAGKLVNYIYDGPASITLPVGSPAAGAVRRLKNAEETVLTVTLGDSTYEMMGGEVMTFQFNGSAFRLL